MTVVVSPLLERELVAVRHVGEGLLFRVEISRVCRLNTVRIVVCPVRHDTSSPAGQTESCRSNGQHEPEAKGVYKQFSMRIGCQVGMASTDQALKPQLHLMVVSIH